MMTWSSEEGLHRSYCFCRTQDESEKVNSSRDITYLLRPCSPSLEVTSIKADSIYKGPLWEARAHLGMTDWLTNGAVEGKLVLGLPLCTLEGVCKA